RRAMNQRAFTLIELIAVIVVMGILAAVVIPASSSTTQTRQRSAALLVSRDLRYLQHRALASGTSTWATFSFTTNTVSYSETLTAGVTAITNQATGQQLTTVLGTASEGGWYAGVTLASLNGSATVASLGFDWQGRPIDTLGAALTTTQIIRITATGQSALTVNIAPETGHVDVSW
ncbi:MAG: type II secretion system protein, partial [Planctomycetota bacterium]|nr:type II secretion system protein [Planctomycetota bacterium]